MLDASMLRRSSQYPCYKNNFVYTGSFNISGNAIAGVNTITHTVPLTQAPDLVDVIFNGASDADFVAIYGDLDPREEDEWFKKGAIWTAGDPGGFTIPLPWVISYEIVGSDILIKATYVQTFIATTAITTEPVSYRIVDYSVFS